MNSDEFISYNKDNLEADFIMNKILPLIFSLGIGLATVSCSSGDKTVPPEPSKTSHIVDFRNYDYSLLSSVAVNDDQYATYNGTTPNRQSNNANYHYSFSGWDKPLTHIKQDTVTKATYSYNPNKYTIKWLNYNNSTLETDNNVSYGTIPVFHGNTPTRDGYRFVGWEPEPTKATNNAIYVAKFAENEKKYTVTWKDEDGSILEIDYDVAYGATPSYESNIPTKASTSSSDYVFNGWSPNIANITEDTTFTASYTKLDKKYYVVWKDYDGSILKEDKNVKYGSTPTPPSVNPTKPSTSLESYVFSGWATINGDPISLVNKSVVYYPQFNPVPKTYTVTWKNYDGKILETDYNVPSGSNPDYNGETPVRPDDAFTHYDFAGFVPAKQPVTCDVVYVANFTNDNAKFTVTWKNYDGTVLKVDDNIEAGTQVEFDGATPTKPDDAQFTYTFSGWSPIVGPVYENTTYIAQFNNNRRSYSITWKNYDGTTLSVDNVAYGTVPSYNGEKPIKPTDGTHIYTFSGWSPTVAAVTGDATYIAQFSEGAAAFTVTWKNYNGSVLKTDYNVAYNSYATYSGKTPSKAKTETTEYIFNGWSPNPTTTKIVDDTIFVAQFREQEIQKYSVSVLNGTYLTVNLLDGITTNSKLLPGAQVRFNLTQNLSGDPTFSIKDSNNNDVSYSISGSKYIFNMPSSNVTINATGGAGGVTPYNSTAKMREYAEQGYNSLVKDANFNNGFVVRKWDNAGDFYFKKGLFPHNREASPSWDLTQWMTDFEINPETGRGVGYQQEDISLDEKRIYNNAKSLTTNSKTGQFTMDCYCGNEYVNGRKKSTGYGDYWWVHFLIEQSYYPSTSFYINAQSSVIMDMEYTINYDNKIGDVSGQLADCAQFEWYLTIQDQTVTYNPSNPNYMWFGVNLYDNRDSGKNDAAYGTAEYGSGVYTYRPGSQAAMGATLPYAEQTRHVCFEMKGRAINAYNEAKSKGKMAGTSVNNLIVGSMNVGYEIHSKRNMSVTVKHMNVYYK